MVTLFNVPHSAALHGYVEATFADDDHAAKNAMLFGYAGWAGRRTFEGTPEEILFYLHATLRTLRAFQQRWRTLRFYVSSRMGFESPRHVNPLRLLWLMYGPTQLDKKAGALIDKFESGGFADMPAILPPPGRGGD